MNQIAIEKIEASAEAEKLKKARQLRGILGHEWTQAAPFQPWRCERCNARPERVAK